MTNARAGPRKNWIDFKALKETARFEPVLAHYGIELLAKGHELVGRCPFHEDKKPSFRVNPEKGAFHCFGCGAKGNVLDFVARKEETNIRRAAELVAEWCGIQTVAPATEKDRRPGEKKSGAPKAAKPEPAESAAAAAPNAPLTFTLKLDPDHPYLAERGLTPETIAHFGVGFCNRGMLRGRIAIPIHNEKGELVAYAGRWIGPDDELPEGEGKYKVPPKFEKSRVLFNLHRAREHAGQGLVLVEGFFDAMKVHQAGFANVVALMGSALSVEQEALLLGVTGRVTLMLDGDAAGRSCAEECWKRLRSRLYVRDLVLEEGAQPDGLADERLQELLAAGRR